MSDLKEALLQAIYDAPDDDAPRLVYADYLLSQPDEASQLRGKLISYLCGPQPTDELVLSRMRRKLDRLKNHFHDWSKRDLGFTLDKDAAKSLEYERGFLSYLHVSYAHWREHRERLMAFRPPLLGLGIHWAMQFPDEDLRFFAGLRRFSVTEAPWMSNATENPVLQVLTRTPEASWEQLSIYLSRVWALSSLRLPRLPRLRHLQFCVVGRYQTLPCPSGLLWPGLETIALTRVALSLDLVRALPGGFSSLNLSNSVPDEELHAWLMREPLVGLVVGDAKNASVLMLGWWLLDNFPSLKQLSWYSSEAPLNALLVHPRVRSKEVVLRGVFQ